VYQKSRAATAANTRFHHRKQHNTAKCNVTITNITAMIL